MVRRLRGLEEVPGWLGRGVLSVVGVGVGAGEEGEDEGALMIGSTKHFSISVLAFSHTHETPYT